MKYFVGLLLSLSMLAGCSPKTTDEAGEAEPIEVEITPICRPQDIEAGSLYLGPIEFLPQQLTVSVLERRARMDHLYVQFNGAAAKDLQDVTALHVGEEIPLAIGDVRLQSPLMPHMITNGELVIDGRLYSGDIRMLGERIAQSCAYEE